MHKTEFKCFEYSTSISFNRSRKLKSKEILVSYNLWWLSIVLKYRNLFEKIHWTYFPKLKNDGHVVFCSFTWNLNLRGTISNGGLSLNMNISVWYSSLFLFIFRDININLFPDFTLLEKTLKILNQDLGILFTSCHLSSFFLNASYRRLYY